MARKKRDGEADSVPAAKPAAKPRRRPKRPQPTETPLFELAPTLEPVVARPVEELSPAELDALHDGLTAVLLKTVGRLGPRAARAATERLREVLMRWAASLPTSVRALGFGYVLDAGPALRRAERTRDGIALAIVSYGERVGTALAPSTADDARHAAVSLVDALAEGLVDAQPPTAVAIEPLRDEIRALVNRAVRG